MGSLRNKFSRPLPHPTRRLPINHVLVDNRIQDFLEHSTRFAFNEKSRLAHSTRISNSAINRLLHAASSPSYATIIRITEILEKEFKRKINPREIATITGKYPTPSVCDLLGCKGCTPEDAWNDDVLLIP